MKQFKVVLVGCGAMSKEWIRVALAIANLELAGLVDLFPENARTRASEFNLENVEIGSSLSEMLERLKPDVVFDVSIPEAHYGVALEAFKHGAHVLGEKPFADTLARAIEMVNAAKSANLTHSVMQNRRFDPNILEVKQFLETGQIGAVTTVNADFFIGAHFGGFRDSMAHVLLLDMAIHTFDQARFMTACDPISVYCLEFNPKDSWYAQGSSAHCIFEMTNGVVFNYRGSWCSEGFHTTWESDWRIIGTRGTLRWDGSENSRAQIVSETGGFLSKHTELEIPKLEPRTAKGHEGLIRNFIVNLERQKPQVTPSSDNIISLAMVFAAIESAETGKRVQVRWA
jgi:predicted dehydrogenase